MAVRWAFVFFCRWVISVSCCGCIVVIRWVSLAGLLCVVIPGPCGWVEFVDLLHAVFLRSGSQEVR